MRSIASNRQFGVEQGCLPKVLCHLDRCDLNIGPPRDFVAIAVQVPMMIPAQWHGEFVADPATECSGLRELKMMRIARRALADQAWLRADEGEMNLVSPTHRFSQGRDGRRWFLIVRTVDDGDSVFWVG